GLPGGSSLSLLLTERRGARNVQQLPPLTAKQILAWAAHRGRSTEPNPGRGDPRPGIPGIGGSYASSNRGEHGQHQEVSPALPRRPDRPRCAKWCGTPGRVVRRVTLPGPSRGATPGDEPRPLLRFVCILSLLHRQPPHSTWRYAFHKLSQGGIRNEIQY